MIEFSKLIRREGWRQKVATERLGVTQPRISDFMRGKVDIFSLDILVDMATVTGLSLRIMKRKAA